MGSWLGSLLPEPSYPVGKYPVPSGTNVRAVQCPHCLNESGTSSWDAMRGFLIRCPHCERLFGKAWNLTSRSRWLALLIANCLGFFWTMRPGRAVPWFVVGVLYWTVGGAIHDSGLLLDGADEVPFFMIGVFVPWIVNIAASLRHEYDRSHSK